MKKLLSLALMILIGVCAYAQQNTRAIFSVSPAMCQNSAPRVANAINALQGVESATPDLTTQTISVVFDAKKIKTDEIIKSMNEVGYTLSIAKPTMSTAARQATVAVATCAEDTGNQCSGNCGNHAQKQCQSGQGQCQQNCKEGEAHQCSGNCGNHAQKQCQSGQGQCQQNCKEGEAHQCSGNCGNHAQKQCQSGQGQCQQNCKEGEAHQCSGNCGNHAQKQCQSGQGQCQQNCKEGEAHQCSGNCGNHAQKQCQSGQGQCQQKAKKIVPAKKVAKKK